MNETIWGWIIVCIINAIGWYITARRSASTNTANNNVAKGQQKEQLSALTTKIDGLPCLKDPKYLQTMGRLIEKVDHLEKTLDRTSARRS